MNDQNLMEDILVTLKGVSDLYLHGTIESSTPQVHAAFKNSLSEVLAMQNAVYNKMSAKGWYQTEMVPMTKVEQTKRKALQA